MTIRALLGASAALLISCADTTIVVDGFDRTCASTDECIPVFEGDVCGSCLAENTAINVNAFDAYVAEMEERQQSCLPVLRGPCDSFVLPECSDGTCVAVGPGD